MMDKFYFKSSIRSPLDEVREIVRAIFYGNFFNSFYLFAVRHFDEPVFYLKIQPILRFLPHGAPLLITSVNDVQLAQQLMAKGALEPDQYQADFHRIFTEGVSRPVCIINASSTEELKLLRYAFRVNLTKMRRSVWQSRNLPRGGNSPWMSTFISPLYTENPGFVCSYISDQITQCARHHDHQIKPDAGMQTITFIRFSPLLQCAACNIKKIELKKCSRCKTVAYCSTSCQKSHWISHRPQCSS